MHKTTALFLFLFLFAASMIGQNTPVPTTIKDSSFLLNNDEAEKNINPSGFAKEVLSDTSVSFSDFSIKRDSISAIKLKKEYSWITNIDSFLTAKKKEDSNQSKIVIKQNSGSSFLDSLFNSAILQTVVWIAAAGLVLFIIFKLFLSEGVFGKRSVKPGIQVPDKVDTRLVNDYEVLLRKAYEEENWRFAMRFLFLKTLQKLNKNEMINYAADKTNSAYVKEIPAAKRDDFASLVLYYEYIWYGNVEIDKIIFDSIENKFSNFLNKI